MAKPYSLDFRQKVIDAIELDGLKKCEASELFNISRNTINLWFQRRAATGDLTPKPRQSRPFQNRIKDWEKFRRFVKANGDKTQQEMAELWDEPISQRTISRAIAKIRQSRKSGATPRRRTALGNAHQGKDVRLPPTR